MLAYALLLLATDPGSLGGAIIHSISRAALAGVAVELRASDQPGPTYRAVTGLAGDFLIAGINPGEYIVAFEKDGFFRPESDGPEKQRVRIIALSEPARLRVELCPYTRLSGRVFDSEGNPRARVRVELLRAGGPQLIAGSTTTEDGGFRFDDLEPGAYILRAIPGRAAPAFYPNSTDRMAAGVLVARGGDLMGRDIRLPP